MVSAPDHFHLAPGAEAEGGAQEIEPGNAPPAEGDPRKSMEKFWDFWI